MTRTCNRTGKRSRQQREAPSTPTTLSFRTAALQQTDPQIYCQTCRQDSAAWTAAPVQPTAAPPSPIRPPGTRTGAKSMADLFKRPQESTLPRPTAVAPSTAAVAPAAIAPEPASTTLKAPESHGEANGWDSLHVTDTVRHALVHVAGNAPRRIAVPTL